VAMFVNAGSPGWMVYKAEVSQSSTV